MSQVPVGFNARIKEKFKPFRTLVDGVHLKECFSIVRRSRALLELHSYVKRNDKYVVNEAGDNVLTEFIVCAPNRVTRSRMRKK